MRTECGGGGGGERRCYSNFEQIFTAFHRQNGDVATAAPVSVGKRPPRPDATHVNAVMAAVVKMLEHWCQVRPPTVCSLSLRTSALASSRAPGFDRYLRS